MLIIVYTFLVLDVYDLQESLSLTVFHLLPAGPGSYGKASKWGNMNHALGSFTDNVGFSERRLS